MTEQTMRERAREAIFDIVYEATGDNCPHWAGDKIYLAILSILAEPTPEMVEAAYEVVGDSFADGTQAENKEAVSIAFSAAIRKAGEG